MSLKNQWKILFISGKFQFLSLMVLGYGIVYGLIFGLTSGGSMQEIFMQTWIWLVIYGVIFFGIGSGAGILTIFYFMLSFHVSRKKAFQIWSKYLWINIIFIFLSFLLLLILKLTILRDESANPLLSFIFGGLGFAPEGEFLKMPLREWISFGTALIFMIGFHLFLALLLAFYCLVGSRFGWQILIAVIAFTVAILVLGFVPNINVLVVTGYYVYRYILGFFLVDSLLYLGVYYLSGRLEVKN